ncbi:MAG: DinB family protein [Chloroflexia bacterium]
MQTEVFVTLYDYFTWARDLMIETAGRLTTEQLRQEEAGVFGSVFDTLAHMAASEWMWLERIEGRSPTKMPAGADFADLAALRAWWDEAHERSMAYLRGADAAELEREIHYQNTQGREFRRLVWHALLHTANHQTEHRTQIAGMLTRFGVEAPATDLVVFLKA